MFSHMGIGNVFGTLDCSRITGLRCQRSLVRAQQHEFECFVSCNFGRVFAVLNLYLWCGVVWCGVVRCGAVRCGVVWCGVVWCGVVWCGVVWCGVMWTMC